MTPDYQAIGERIKAFRLLNNLNREQLAERIGCSVQFIGHIERGTRKMSLETLLAISEALNLSTDYILKDNPSR